MHLVVLSSRQRTGPYGLARPTEFQIYGRLGVASNQSGDIKLSCKWVSRDDVNKHNCKSVTVVSKAVQPERAQTKKRILVQ